MDRIHLLFRELQLNTVALRLCNRFGLTRKAGDFLIQRSNLKDMIIEEQLRLLKEYEDKNVQAQRETA